MKLCCCQCLNPSVSLSPKDAFSVSKEELHRKKNKKKKKHVTIFHLIRASTYGRPAQQKAAAAVAVMAVETVLVVEMVLLLQRCRMLQR